MAADLQLCILPAFVLHHHHLISALRLGLQKPKAGRQQAAAMRAVVQRVKSASVEVRDGMGSRPRPPGCCRHCCQPAACCCLCLSGVVLNAFVEPRVAPWAFPGTGGWTDSVFNRSGPAVPGGPTGHRHGGRCRLYVS